MLAPPPRLGPRPASWLCRADLTGTDHAAQLSLALQTRGPLGKENPMPCGPPTPPHHELFALLNYAHHHRSEVDADNAPHDDGLASTILDVFDVVTRTRVTGHHLDRTSHANLVEVLAWDGRLASHQDPAARRTLDAVHQRTLLTTVLRAAINDIIAGAETSDVRNALAHHLSLLLGR